MFDQVDAKDLPSAVDLLIGQMIDLLRLLNTFLGDVLGTFVGQVILQGEGVRNEVGKVLSPDFEKFQMPFWTAMPVRMPK